MYGLPRRVTYIINQNITLYNIVICIQVYVLNNCTMKRVMCLKVVFIFGLLNILTVFIPIIGSLLRK